jgi:hypothetical protein
MLDLPRFTMEVRNIMKMKMTMKKTSLIWVLLGCALFALAATQCGGDTTTSTGPLNGADGGTGGTAGQTGTGIPSGW